MHSIHSAMDMTKTAPLPLPHAVAEWKELYRHRSYMMARLTMQKATEAYPDVPEAWFLLGLTELAVRDPRRAQEAFERVQETLKHRGLSLGPEFAPMPALIPRILDAIERRILVSGPLEWDEWLRNPGLIDSTKTNLEKISAIPLGRSAPLIPISTAAIGTYKRKGALGDSLPDIQITVDSMRDLMGKDVDLHIHPEHISLIDSSIQIRTIQPIEPLSVTAPSAPTRQVPPREAFAPSRTQQQPPPRQQPQQQSFPYQPASQTTQHPVAEPAPEKRQESMKTLATALGGVAAGLAAATATAHKQPQTPEKQENPWLAWEHKVEDLIRKGESNEALGYITEALKRYPQSSRLHEIHAEALQEFGHRQEALRAWMETYKQAQTAGADERANRAYREAYELAKENGDLLLDLAGLAASLGAAGMAVTMGKMAADLYRRRNDRPKLAAALRQLISWQPADTALQNELRRLEGDDRPGGTAATRMGENSQTARNLDAWGDKMQEAAPEPAAATATVGTETTYGTVSPPKRVGHGDTVLVDESGYERTRPPAAPRVSSHPEPTMADLKQRALNATIAGRNDRASGREDGSLGVAVLIGAIIILFISIAAGSVIPAIIGFVVSHGVAQQYENAADATSTAQLNFIKIAKVVCGIAFFLGLIL
ncbi:MAG: hypothetical protein PWP23_3326 [Candidatus Sumerlaeota bacterium]|nr:hypothetical protein [Candidatus Sumerlaeota bacterium]